MRKMRMGVKRLLTVILALCVVSGLGIAVAQAEESRDTGSGSVDGGDIAFSAAIYEDADRTTGRVELTGEGAALFGWTYNTDRYLGIEIDHLPMTGEQYQIVIEMAPILYLNQNTDPALANTTVAFTRNADLIANTDSVYPLKTYSLSSLTYQINAGTESLKFGLPLRYDNALWNKRDGALLGDGATPLLRVYLQQIIGGSPVTVGSYDVNLLQATTSGAVEDSPSTSLYSENDSSYSTSVMGMDEKLQLFVSRSSNTSYKGGYYYNDLEIQLTLPTCTVNGAKYTLEYEDVRLRTSGGASQFDCVNTDGVLTMTAEQFYFAGGSLLSVWFKAPEDIREVKGVHTFRGSVTVTADGYAIIDEKAFVITLDNSSQPLLGAASGDGDASVINNDVVQFLGKLALKNEASFSNGSGPLEVALTFDQENTDVIGVTGVQLMCDRDTETIQIWYTLVDEDGNIYTDTDGKEFTATVRNKHYNPDSTDTDNKYQLFNRSDLPEGYRKYYFKTLRYTIGNLDGGTYAYHTGAGKAPYSAGTIWGYVLTDEVPSGLPRHEMRVYQVSGEEKTELTALYKTATVKIDAGTSVSYGMDGAKVSAPIILAGDPVKIEGNIFIPSYPYTSNNCLNDIRLGFILPEGMSVNESAVTAKYAGGILGVAEVTSKSVGTNKVLWIVSFERGGKIGYYNEELEAIENGAKLTFSVQFNTERTMSTQTLNLREFVFVAGEGISNGSSGSYGDHAWVDTYDLNGNGSTADKVGCYGVEATQSITIEAVPPQLEITDTLRKEDGSEGSSLSMDSGDEVIYYEFDVESTKGGQASGFYYLVPIANGVLEEEEDFLVNQKNKEFKLRLSGPVTITNKAGTGLKVYYTTKEVTSYAQALALTEEDWFTGLPGDEGAASLAPEGTAWADVTMLKIVAEDSVIVNGSQNTISIPLKYSGDYTLYKHYAGMQVEWKSRGYYGIVQGHNGFSGTLSTEGCTITINYVEADPRVIVLTAAKDGAPLGEGAVKEVSFDLIEFYLAQQYTIGEIRVTEVNLVGSDHDFKGASGAEANTDFCITVSVEDDQVSNPAVDILKDGTIVGSLDANSTPTFKFSIKNADALSDIVTERYVELTLFGSNGVIVPVKIIIRRELAEAENPVPAIVAGKLYLPMSDTTTSTTISQDSAFTAQFITSGMIPKNYFDRTLKFDEELERGTKLTMIDWTDASAPGYYHYTVGNDTTASIPLTEFTAMGSDTKYSEPQTAELVTERLMFIVQMPEDSVSETSNAMCLRKMKKPDTEGGEAAEDTSDPLKFSTAPKRTFRLETGKTSAKIGEEFTLTYTSEIGTDLTDSRFTGRSLALVIGAADGSAIPAEARLMIGGTAYTLNSEGRFIVPLDAVQKGNGSRAIRLLSETAGSVSLSAELWAAATSNAQKAMMGERVAGPITITLAAGTLPSLRVDSMSERLLYPEDLANTVAVSYQMMDVTELSIEVQIKDAAGYTTQSSVLEAVDGKTDHSMGVFVIANRDGTVSLKFSSNMPAGTYRLLFTVTNQNGSIEVPYYFIVTR